MMFWRSGILLYCCLFKVSPNLLNICLTLFRLASLPEKPATIDWSYYRKVVAKAGMVDEFEKKVRSIGFSIS